jgi:hypothetical protein
LLCANMIEREKWQRTRAHGHNGSDHPDSRIHYPVFAIITGSLYTTVRVGILKPRLSMGANQVLSGRVATTDYSRGFQATAEMWMRSVAP